VLAVFMTDNGAGYRSSIQPAAPGSGAEPDPAIIPLFGEGGPDQLEKGLVKVITGGAGWVAPDKESPLAIVRGTGEGAKAEIVRPGQILRIVPGIGGFASEGTYPSMGDPQTDGGRIKVHVPPPAQGEVQHARVEKVERKNSYFKTLITDPGKGYVGVPDASFKLDDGTEIEMQNVNLDKGGVITADPKRTNFLLSKPIAVEFKIRSGQKEPERKAQAKVLPGFSIQSVVLEGKPSSGYGHDLEIAFSGGDVVGDDFVMPEFDFDFEKGNLNSVSVRTGGKGFYRSAPFTIDGGKGFNAALFPVLSEGNRGKLIAVKVLRPGSNYFKAVRAYTQPGERLLLDVTISTDDKKGISSVSLPQGADYTFHTIPSIFLTAGDGALDYVNNPAKGKVAKFTFNGDGKGGVKIDEAGEGYLPNTANRATTDSLPAIARYSGIGQVASANQAYGFIAEVAKPKVNVEQVLYDSVISKFSSMASDNLKPFGGAFGGKSAPDGYGLGNALSSATKVLGVLYNLHQHHAQNKRDAPLVIPSLFVVNEAVGGKYEFSSYVRNHPFVTLKGGLKTMTQALQRTISLFFRETPYTNNPNPTDWKMAYFSMYDKAGRVVVNPTATIPVLGVVSSVKEPADIPDDENKPKVGLAKWTKGRLWSGFGVSDQWNDQHYFYGYYLSAAGLLAVLDGSWDPDKRPANLWSDADRIGTAVDQWMKTLAYDPRLDSDYYDYGKISKAGITYEKYSFFDQWNGHSWATGVPPGRAGDVEQNVPWSKWSSFGTGNEPYDDENENSTWEGLQAFSAIILWGAGTGRKSVVNQGMYLLTTGNAASDLYFLDKNYNLSVIYKTYSLKRGAQNIYTWCPVTTAEPAGTGNAYEKGTAYVDSNPEAFYGEASAGCSILHKGSPSLNNFFYSYPTGSKFIQAYPPTPWTMGMSRNLGYMKKWSEAMARPEWKQARESALFQPGNWLGMAMSSALCGFPYNPGDDPEKVRPYVERLWASWIVDGSAPGSQATMQPAEAPTSVLNFLHTLDVYGPPDWSIYAKAVDASGKEADDQIVFTAAFSKTNADSKGEVTTTFVAFNPTWKTCYVYFFRIGADGALSDAPIHQNPIRVDPKKMTVQRDLFKLKLGRVALITDNPDRIRGLPELLATYGGESSILSVAELSKLSLIHPEVVIVCTDKGTRWMRPNDGQDQGEVLNAFGNYKVVGMGYGAARLFSLWSLDISAGKCGPHGESDRPLTVELAEALKYPEAIPNPVQVAAKGSDALGAFGVYEFLHDQVPRRFERIARFTNDRDHWPIARTGNYLLWGFEASVDQMTEAGKRLFVNVLVNHKAHAATW
jgi:Glycosyl hydrolase family 81 C-terminal domain